MNRWIVGLVVVAAACSPSKKRIAAPPSSPDPMPLAASVSDEAWLVVAIRTPTPLMRWVSEIPRFGGLPDEQLERAEEELASFLEQRTGIDARQVSRLTGFAVGEQDLAVVLHGAKGTPKGAAAGEHQGTRLTELAGAPGILAATVDDGVLLGTRGGVTAGLDAAANATSKSRLQALFANTDGAWLVAALDSRRVSDAEISAMTTRVGIETGLVSLGERIRVVLEGDEQGLRTLAAQLKAMLQMPLAQAEAQKEAALKDETNLLGGLMAIMTANQARRLAALADPRVSDGRLTLDVDVGLGDPTFSMAILGMMAAVAIPQFMKYIKKSKTAEAAAHLRALYDGVRRYHAEHGKLPPSAGPTPPLGRCCNDGGKCQPRAEDWKQEGWRALLFSIEDPHYYSYTVEASPAGFTVRANGDLDCDGVFSTFEVYGTLQADGTIAGGGVVYRENELE